MGKPPEIVDIKEHSSKNSPHTFHYHVKIDKSRCKGCKLCIVFCPHNVIELAPKLNTKGMRFVKVKETGVCRGCGICFLMCPDACIEIYELTENRR